MTNFLLAKKKSYSIEFSPLYNLSNKKKLAELLGSSLSDLIVVIKSDSKSNYNIFTDRTSKRFITEPVGNLAKIHKKLLSLLIRISPPEYLHSAVKTRSYISNAKVHRNGNNVLKVDIKKFFPNVKFNSVYKFFRDTLKCSIDVSTILAKLCTVETTNFGIHLPTGSCISPILSFYSNIVLFNSVYQLCLQRDCSFTLYIDDMIISGDNASKELLNLVVKEVYKHGYGYHKIKIYRGVPAKITGLIVSNGIVSLPYIRSKKIRELDDAVSIASGKLKSKLLASLVGRLSEAEQINPEYKNIRFRTLNKYSSEWAEVVIARRKSQDRSASKRQPKVEHSLAANDE